ncbi:hypothetical protein SLEP1_g22096 [Rubroshorea leprosula]|uniref:tRNA (guanosine(18)-2'-O)-methyltransferase TARBP1 n=1 Tax=Rubroshorea leprosula TaxID=152421 RepID=A0AAV5JHF1_9ROSI|nr:hypothetical protein SLEP1_g22096 [Rubroshorea leprosula]
MTDSMASLVSSLSHGFREVPPAAVPPMLDCLLASTGLSPSSVFSALFDNFPNLIQAAKKDGKLNSDHCTGIVSVIGALCYLLEKMGANQEALQSFIWKGFIPLMTMGPEFDREFLNQIADLFFDIVAKTNSWELLEASLVPFFLSSLRISAGAIEKEELDATEWGVKVNNLNMVDKDHDISPSGAFPLPLSCHVLSLILDAALQSLQAAPAPELVNGCWHAEKCASNLLWDICSMTKKLLLQSLEHRSCAIGFLLPIIFKAFIANYSFEISIHGNPHIFTRNSFFKEIWACCRALFSLGSLERRDAYGVLSLYLSFFSCSDISGKCYMSDGEEFDIKTEKEFWNEIKRGLVDKESLVRKQSLHILKRVLCASGGSQYNSGFSEDKLQRKHPGHGMTKRELWADKEAKSLGVGKLCSVAESGFNSRQQWEAFLLLYEMLDEYGTHLVDAAWNHQITLLLQFSLSHDNFVSAISRGPQQTQMETFNEVFSWLSILWERGFCHDNPQVRCMIMHSFLGIEWIKYGACAKSIPESFVLGPFMEALNDPVHHSDFGVKGVYSSKAIESAAQFLLHYASYLDARRWIAFLINLASLAKRQSFGRAGLMGLAECIASAACGIRKDDTYDAEWYKDASPDKAPQESSPERSFLDNKIELLEVLRFIIQSSKQHFNPNYRVQVCGKVLKAAASLMYATDVPLEILLSFISTLPREFTDNGGSLKVGVQDWLLGNRKNHAANCYGIEAQLLKNLHDFPKKFVSHQYLVENFDDEDLEAWELQAKRWARVLFLVIEEKEDLMPILLWKWLCIESLLSIPLYAFENGIHLEDGSFFFSDVAVRNILIDTVESLENAGEDSALPMLRAVRLALELLSSGRLYSAVSSYSGVGTQDKQMIWQLVHSCWILHVSCNKRRVAPIAALLSSVLHPSLLSDDNMHMMNGESGPLKWFVEKLLQEGTKSPRTIRLASLHLTGLWFSNPRTIKYYIKELKLLTLYGSVAFDEDFEAELTENHDVRTEVSLLAKSPDPELTKAFINTELYARVSVAVLFNKLADLADLRESSCENKDCQAALESGKLFLLELLDSVVNEKDLAKELYKKYSAIHRRKVRAWQMLCVLSRFIDENVVGKVAESLHIALYRNNLPSVRQYLETFAINIYVKFPALVAEQLVPMLRNYDMRPQALSSYVFIAANVILHASKAVQFSHLDELLPPIIPLLTSHHHSLRGFTQVLVHQVLCRLFSPLDSTRSDIKHLEKRCFEDLKSYLAENPDCVRLRASMEGYLDAYNPNTSATPSGIFVSRVEEEMEFECVPTSLMEQVLNFLNDVREDLRCSMAKDVVAIKNESLIGEDPNSTEILSAAKIEKLLELPKDARLDFQKKITLSKHEKQDSHSVLGNREAYKRLLEMEKEDDLLNELLKSRSLAMEMVMGNRQQFILVASFIDRVPNLAGLARTCEVFRASGLAIADTKIVADKQFQLISVTAEKWVPIIEVPVNSVRHFLEKKKWEGFSILGLEQTANSIPLDQYIYPKKTVLVLGREKEGIPVDIIHILDACIEIPQLGVVRSLNVHVSGAIALWEYTRQQRSQ